MYKYGDKSHLISQHIVTVVSLICQPKYISSPTGVHINISLSSLHILRN